MKGRIRSGSLAPRLFLLLAALYLLTANGRIVNRDGEAMFQVARSLVEDGSFAVPAASVFTASVGPRGVGGDGLSYATETALPGRDGRLYAKYGPGQSLVSVPFYWLGRRLSEVWPAMSPYLLTRFAVAMLNPLVTALTAVLVLGLAVEMGYGRRAALLAAFTFGVGTLAWPYARSYASEPLTGLLLLSSFYALHRVGKPALWFRSPLPMEAPGDRASGVPYGWLVLAGLALGAAALTRPAALIAAPVFAAYLVARVRERRSDWAAVGPGLGALAGPVVLLLAILAAYNWLRFGSALSTGYATGGWTTPFGTGLYGLLVSPGKGLLWYNPALILALVGAGRFFRRGRAEALCVLGLAVVWIGFHAPYQFWEGGWSWGPRFLVPLLPFLALPAAAAGNRLAALPWRRLVPLALVLGAVVQFPAVGADYTRYLWSVQVSHPQDSYERLIYRPATSPLLGQWTALAEVVGNVAAPGGLEARRRETMARLAELEGKGSAEAELSAAVLDLTALTGINVPDNWLVLLYVFGAPAWVVLAGAGLLLAGVFGGLWLLDQARKGED